LATLDVVSGGSHMASSLSVFPYSANVTAISSLNYDMLPTITVAFSDSFCVYIQRSESLNHVVHCLVTLYLALLCEVLSDVMLLVFGT